MSAHVRLTREEIANIEVGHTEISGGLARVMTIAFLATIALPPILQIVHEANTTPREFSSVQWIHSVPGIVEAMQQSAGSLWDRTMATNRRLMKGIEEYESQLADRSLLTEQLLPPTQFWLTAYGGLGNEKAYVGRDGWLYFRSDVEYLTGPGFLRPEILRQRRQSGKQYQVQVQPDPRVAIIEFDRQLTQRGIQLIVMPMPGKAAIHPEQLSSRATGVEPLQNPSFDEFLRDLGHAGVLVFDPTDVLRRQRESSGPQFLRTDTHWTPTAMQGVARELAHYLKQAVDLPDREPVQWTAHDLEVTNLGDIAQMLHLPAQQSLIAPECVTVRAIRSPGDADWTPDPAADILLLGDSYTNIYSLPDMNWGQSAGFAEHLSFELGRHIDVIAQNDGGSHAVRQTLHQQLARGEDRLRGKRVVIWEFAARELSSGDWKQFPLPEPSVPRPAKDQPPASAADDEFIVQATVRAAAGAPVPGSVPYRDAVTGVHLDEVQGMGNLLAGREIMVYTWGMRNNQLLPAARLASGQNVTLRITRWDAVRQKYERFNRMDPEDPDFHLIDLPTYWAEELQ